MAEIRFFAIRDDIVPVLEAVERKQVLKYVRAGRFLTSTPDLYSRGSEIPDLGLAARDSAIACQSFLVCAPEMLVEIEPVDQYDGVRSYHIDQLRNPNTITFSSGGLWAEDVLLYGRFATVSASFSDYARRLMNRFRDELGKRFDRVQGSYVGPRAMELLKAGKRLTIAQQSPREFDLSLPR